MGFHFPKEHPKNLIEYDWVRGWRHVVDRHKPRRGKEAKRSLNRRSRRFGRMLVHKYIEGSYD